MTTRTARLALLATLCAGIVSCDTPAITTTSAAGLDDAIANGTMYDPTALIPLYYHWSLGKDIAIYVDRTAEPPDADLDAAVRAGITAWVPVGRLGELKMHVVSDLHAADVIFHHVAAPRLVISDVCDPTDIGAGGYTFLCFTSDNQAVAFNFIDGSPGHVKMDVAVSRGAAPDANAFRSIVMHEMGHVLGIGAHSTVSTDLMFGSPRAPGPTSRDAATLRFVLSQRADVRF